MKNVLLENDRKRNRPTSGGTCRGACVVDTLSRDCGSGIKWCSLFNYSNESFSLFVIYSGILKTRPMFQTCLLEFWGVGVFLKNERSFQLVYASIPFSHLKKNFFLDFYRWILKSDKFKTADICMNLKDDLIECMETNTIGVVFIFCNLMCFIFIFI